MPFQFQHASITKPWIRYFIHDPQFTTRFFTAPKCTLKLCNGEWNRHEGFWVCGNFNLNCHKLCDGFLECWNELLFFFSQGDFRPPRQFKVGLHERQGVVSLWNSATGIGGECRFEIVLFDIFWGKFLLCDYPVVHSDTVQYYTRK